MSPGAARRVIVTGASGAFGTAISRALAAQGAQVIGLDLDAGGDPAVPVLACDVTDPASVAAVVPEAVGLLGGLDVLVNNAGIGGPASAGEPPDERVERMLDVNTLGAWRVTAAAIDDLVATRGRVIFVASRMSFLGLPLGAAYGVSKRAVVAYADALRAEYGTHVQVCCVHPAMVKTPIHDATRDAGLDLEALSREEPLEAVVRAVVRVCSDMRVPRDVATTRAGAVQLFAARHLPGVVDRVIASRVRAQAEAGAFDRAELAAGLRERNLGRR